MHIKCTVHGERGHYSWNVCNCQQSRYMCYMYRILQPLHEDTIMYKDTDTGITTGDWRAQSLHLSCGIAGNG